MRTEKQETGHAGEDLARSYLIEQGYTILDSNWQWGHLEVDVIALDGQQLVFVEVKTRASAAFGNPESAVTKQKQRNIIRAANGYMTKFGYTYEVRFDIISIVQNGQGTQIEHLKDAYSPNW